MQVKTLKFVELVIFIVTKSAKLFGDVQILIFSNISLDTSNKIFTKYKLG
jgi:hypothetical protein